MRLKFRNLSTFRPEMFPQPTTSFASSTVGMLIDALFGRFQDAEGVVPLADDAADQRRLELQHRVPRHGHDVRPALSGGRDQHNRPRFEQAVDPRTRGKFFFIGSTPFSSAIQ